jgi:hypothetical protein
MKRILVSLSVLLFISAFAIAEEKDQYSDITIRVLKEETGKPVRNASIVLHSVNDKGEQQKGGFGLKSDAEGKASYNGVPYGKLRIQVIARGLQTFGDDFVIKEPQQEILIKLKPPQDQYSIYNDKNPAPNAPEKR